MKIETIRDRVRLLRRLIARTSTFNINDIPLPADSRCLSLSPLQVADEWRSFLLGLGKKNVPDHYFNLYVHVPFCRSKCTYCIYDSARLRSPKDANACIEGLVSAARFFSSALSGAVFQNVHVGGGTPSLLDEDLLERLFDAVLPAFRFSPTASRTIECNPDSLTPAKAGLMRSHGFNKVSMGVQSFSPVVLHLINRRYQTPGSVRRAVETVRRAGLATLNCDLMLGLHGDDASSFLAGFGELLGMGPDTVMVAKVQPPPHYLRKHFAGRYDAFLKHVEEHFAGVVDGMLEAAAARGYGTDNPEASELGWRFWRKGFTPPYDESRPYYCTGGEHPSSCLGIGRYARSRMFAAMLYQSESAGDAFDAGAPVYGGWRVDQRYEMVRYVVSQLSKNRAVPAGPFRAMFGRSLEEVWGELFREMQAEGLVEMDGEGVRFPTTQPRELFIASRLFFDRRTMIASLASADGALVRVGAGGMELTFGIEHVKADRPYLGTEGDLGLYLHASNVPPEEERTGRGVTALALKVFKTIAGKHPWLAAVEVGEHMARRLPGLGGALGLTRAPDVRLVEEEG